FPVRRGPGASDDRLGWRRRPSEQRGECGGEAAARCLGRLGAPALSQPMDAEVASLCRCPKCGGRFAQGEPIACAACGTPFPEVGGIPCLFPDPTERLAAWRRQIARYAGLVEQSVQSADRALAEMALLPSTRRRLLRVTQANRDNCARILELFRSARIDP